MLRPRSTETIWRIVRNAIGDALAGCAALTAVVLLRRNFEIPGTRTLLPALKFPLDAETFLLFSLSAILSHGAAGFYSRTSSARHRPTLLVALPLQMAIISLGATFSERVWPRTVLIAAPLLHALLVIIWRRVSAMIWPPAPPTAVVVGGVEAAQRFVRAADGDPMVPLRVEGIVSLGVPTGDRRDLGPFSDPRAKEAIVAAQEVVAIGSDADETLRLELLTLRGPGGFLYVPSTADAMLSPVRFGHAGEHPIGEIAMRGAAGFGAAYKRFFDLAIGSIVTLIALPLMILVATLIVVGSGFPILFRQRRVGLNGRAFEMWKFRSMENGRVTAVGSFLRRYRLDELPQLFNVLGGDMSLIGPRPELPELTERITQSLPYFPLRHWMRPGIAGLAQTAADWDQSDRVKLTYDLQYLCSWSPSLDLRILLRALVTALSGRGS